MQLSPTGKRELALAAAGAIVVGSALPWGSTTTIFGTLTRNGLDTSDGKFTALLGLAAIAAILYESNVPSRLAGAVAAALAIWNLVDIAQIDTIDTGYGLWIVAVAGLIVAVQPEWRRSPVTPADADPPPPPLPPP